MYQCKASLGRLKYILFHLLKVQNEHFVHTQSEKNEVKGTRESCVVMKTPKGSHP